MLVNLLLAKMLSLLIVDPVRPKNEDWSKSPFFVPKRFFYWVGAISFIFKPVLLNKLKNGLVFSTIIGSISSFLIYFTSFYSYYEGFIDDFYETEGFCFSSIASFCSSCLFYSGMLAIYSTFWFYLWSYFTSIFFSAILSSILTYSGKTSFFSSIIDFSSTFSETSSILDDFLSPIGSISLGLLIVLDTLTPFFWITFLGTNFSDYFLGRSSFSTNYLGI